MQETNSLNPPLPRFGSDILAIFRGLKVCEYAVAIHSVQKMCLSVLREKPPYEMCSADVNRRKTDHPSLSASFYHSNSRLLIEVEEDNDRIYFCRSSLSLSVALSILSSLFPLCPFIPSTQPGRVYLMTQAISFFLYCQATSEPAEPERACASVFVCVSMCVISSGLAALTWLGEFVSILLVRGVVEALLTLSPLITPLTSQTNTMLHHPLPTNSQ